MNKEQLMAWIAKEMFGSQQALTSTQWALLGITYDLIVKFSQLGLTVKL